MFYPDSLFKTIWDMVITFAIIFTSLVTPFRIAFTENDDTFWKTLNLVIDSVFLVDIFINFNSVVQDEDLQLIENRCKVSVLYIKSWFFIDVLSILPFDIILNGSDINGMAKLTRIGRMYKIIKLTRLLRVLKVVKERSKLVKFA